MAATPEILLDQPIATWFGIGGKARRLARPRTLDELRACVEIDPRLRILGDGANLLVADEGVDELVVSLSEGEFAGFEIGPPDQRGGVTVRAGAGVHLFKLINATVDAGLAGLETLAGIPACVGGATVMNAGGKYGSTGDHIASVRVLPRDPGAEPRSIPRNRIECTYRHCSLVREGLIVTHVDFRLRRATDPAALRARLKDITAYKQTTQPLNAHSAGCCFRNPTLIDAIKDIGTPGTRVSAGMLIDRAGCKGLAVGTARVSDQHANFIVAGPGCRAADVLELMRRVRARVLESFGVTLEPEVVIWGASL
ncbi:MAG: UDP-N-acetylmuramate dehydrogenase [Phycisphaerales bacterium]